MSGTDDEEMIEVRLAVTLQVCKDDEFEPRSLTKEAAVKTAREAVRKALDFSEERGFEQPEADWLSVRFVDVEGHEETKYLEKEAL